MGLVRKVDGFTYGSQGGAWIKVNTIKIAQELQFDLCKDILDFTYDKDKWKQRILEAKTKVFTFKLEKESLIKRGAISKKLTDYGQPTINSATGEQKIRADGKPCFAPIPAHVKVAQQLINEGEYIDVGDRIEFIVYDKTAKTIPISVKHYELLLADMSKAKDILLSMNYVSELFEQIPEKIKATFTWDRAYDAKHYWERIQTPLLEILKVCDTENVYTHYAECWGFNEKQLAKLKTELNEIDETEEDDSDDTEE